MPSSMCPICGKPYSGASCPRCKRVSRSSRSHSKRSQSQEKARKQTNPWRSEYSRKEYKNARQIAIRRTNGRCAACGKVCAKRRGSSWLLSGAGVHHIRPLSQGGGNGADNLVLLCVSCHNRIDAARRAAGR